MAYFPKWHNRGIHTFQTGLYSLFMDSKQLDKLNLDLRRFFDFKNHNHIYHFHIWKGDFSVCEVRSAATYSDIADRFEAAIAWIQEIRKQDRLISCPECGAKDDRVARILSFSVMTGDDELFREEHDDLSWNSMIRLLQMAVSRLREMPEPPSRCPKCGRRRARPDRESSGTVRPDFDAIRESQREK